MPTWIKFPLPYNSPISRSIYALRSRFHALSMSLSILPCSSITQKYHDITGILQGGFDRDDTLGNCLKINSFDGGQYEQWYFCLKDKGQQYRWLTALQKCN